MMIKHPTIFRQWRAWISVVLWALLSIPIAPAGTPETVFFYNPESSVDNFAALKAEFDRLRFNMDIKNTKLTADSTLSSSQIKD